MAAVDLYRGEVGARYWERNAERCKKDGPVRAVSLRSLIPEVVWHEPWLEVGCGRGDNLLSTDVGLDCDVRQLQHLPPGVIGVIGEATDLPFPDNHFEVVFSVGCLMHLPSCETDADIIHHCTSTYWQAVKEMTRVSRRYVVLGEYVAETERDLLWNVETGEQGTGEAGLLWERPYPIPQGWKLERAIKNIIPFDPEVTFLVWRQDA